MIDTHKITLLKNFFGAYFHEDWPREAESPDAIVEGYASVSKTGDLITLSKAIIEYSNMFINNTDINNSIFSELGCYYNPSGDGLSAKAWLERVAKQLLESGKVSR